MKIQMNRQMKTLLERQGWRDIRELELDNGQLQSLIDSGIYRHGGIFSIRPIPPTDEEMQREYDRTGYECSVNHIHIEDYVGHDVEPTELLRTGLACAVQVHDLLSSEYPAEHFKIIINYHKPEYPTCTIRFHKQRADEHWISDDLDGYKHEAVLTIDIRPL